MQTNACRTLPDGFPEFRGRFFLYCSNFSVAFPLHLSLFAATWPGVKSVKHHLAEFIFNKGSRSKGLGRLRTILANGSKFERGGLQELILTQVEGRVWKTIISIRTI